MTVPQNEKSQQCCFNFRRKRLKQKDLFLTMSTRRPHIEKSPAFAGLSFGHIQWICCWPDCVGCGGAGTTSPGETIKRSTVSVVTNVQLQLMFVH